MRKLQVLAALLIAIALAALAGGALAEDGFGDGFFAFDWPLMREDVCAAAFADSKDAEPEEPTVLGSEYPRSSISSITFTNSIFGAPSDAWDVSAEKDGSVLAWLTRNEELYNLTIAGLDGVGAPENCDNLFRGYSNVTFIDFNGCFDTSGATGMARMFSGCSSLTELDLSSFDTSKVTDMASLFSGCASLERLNLSGFDTAQVRDMSGMFSGCENLATFNLSGFDTSRARDMSAMFSGCASLERLNLSSFNISGLKSAREMFSGCAGLRSLDLSGFDTSGIEDMSRMFADCTRLTELDLTGFDTAKATNLDGMFSGCSAMEAVRTSERFAIDPEASARNMFQGCGVKNLTGPADGSLLRKGDSGERVIELQQSLAKLGALNDLADGDFGKQTEDAVRELQQRFGMEPTGIAGAEFLALLKARQNPAKWPVMRSDASGKSDAGLTVPGSDYPRASIATIRFEPSLFLAAPDAWDISDAGDGSVLAWVVPSGAKYDLFIAGDGGVRAPADCSGLFRGYASATAIDFNGCFDTSLVRNMEGMFQGCGMLSALDLSSFDTSKVTSTTNMFQGCTTLAGGGSGGSAA